MRFAIVSTLVAASLVAAQTTHIIKVGENNGTTFNPSNITAAPGDIVSFTFLMKNHTATQSTFAEPCKQLDNQTATPPVVGISSGYMKVDNGAQQFPAWNIKVQDTTPLWFFCLQADHCSKGMVFSINATPEKSHDAYVANAKKFSGNGVPAPETGGALTQPSGDAAANGSGATPVGTGAGAADAAAAGTSGTAAGAQPTGGASARFSTTLASTALTGVAAFFFLAL